MGDRDAGGSEASSRAGTPALHRFLRRAGWVLIAAHAALVPLSYGIAAVSPFGVEQPREERALRHTLEVLPGLPRPVEEALEDAVTGETPLARPAVRGAVDAGILGLATLAALAVIGRLRRAGDAVDEDTVALLVRGTMVFAALSVLAYPMFNQDFWLSVAWGRMIADGVNPYYHGFTEAALAGLPLEPYETRMTYGPLWAAVCGGLELLLPRLAPLEFLVHKLLPGLLLSCVALLRRLLADRPPLDRALALALFGWLPLSVHYVVAEGHNGVAMVAMLLAWLLAWRRARVAWSPFALALSVGFKYVTAPLLLLELRMGLGAGAGRRRRWGVALLGAGALFALLVAVFARDVSFLHEASHMRNWRLLTPARFLEVACHRFLGAAPPPAVLDALVLGALALPLAGTALRFLRAPAFDELAELTYGALLAVALVLTGHTWPWFLLWPLAAGAVRWRRPLFSWTWSIFVLAPFFDLFWAMASGWDEASRASLRLFAVWLVLVWPARWWLRGPG